MDVEKLVRDATANHLDALGVWDHQALTIPAFLLKPTEGKCIHCGYTSTEQDEGEWLHEECRDELIADQERDYRLDSPTHTPYGGRKI